MIFLFSTGNLVLSRLDKIVCQVLEKHMIFGFLKFMCFIGTKHLCASCLQNTRVLARQTLMRYESTSAYLRKCSHVQDFHVKENFSYKIELNPLSNMDKLVTF